MTSFEVVTHRFSRATGTELRLLGGRYRNWPIVYVLDDGRQVYVGETGNASKRMEQHGAAKGHLKQLRIVLDDRFNKSVCLDLESHLIRYFAGDEKLDVLNRNDGITDADYFGREDYRKTFQDVFDELRALKLFERTIPEIENSDLFKYSPFKALTPDQAVVVTDILEGMFEDLETEVDNTVVIQGTPGTGKTIVAVFLLKLLRDIATADPEVAFDADTMFSEFFTSGNHDLLGARRLGLVVPQQSLRKTIQRVFRKTPGLAPEMVLTPFEIGKATVPFDLLIVDEAHRLSQRANQPSGPQNRDFRLINERLFGADDPNLTQLDWIRKQSRHQVFLLDRLQ
ncbi:MAG: DNA/RNA helicase domain-containing protein, partial [Agromyces sp.]